MRRGWALAPVILAAAAVLEVVVFVLVARWLGLPAALLASVGTSLLGVWSIRREGPRAWRRFQAALGTGRPPGAEVSDGLVGLLGGLLLALPGFLGDVIGLLVLVPPVRALARRGVQRAAEGRLSPAVAGNLFGPRKVRVRRGAAHPDAGPPPGPAPAAPAAGAAIEGEIVEPGGQP